MCHGEPTEQYARPYRVREQQVWPPRAGGIRRSVLLARMRALDVHRMPPIGSLQVDDAGVATVAAWVAALDTCE